MILDSFATKRYLKKSDLKIVMTEKQCSKCKCLKAMEHFQTGEGEYFKTCDVCRKSRQRHYDKNKDEINRKRREERACNGNIKCECGLIVKPEKWDDHMSWSWHWSGLKGKILNQYAEKLAYAKKKDRKILEEEKRQKLEELLQMSGREFII